MQIRYKNEKIEKLRRLKKSDPKEFWRNFE